MIPRSLKDFEVAPLTWLSVAGSSAGFSAGVGARERSLLFLFGSDVSCLSFFLGTADDVLEPVSTFLFFVSFILKLAVSAQTCFECGIDPDLHASLIDKLQAKLKSNWLPIQDFLK